MVNIILSKADMSFPSNVNPPGLQIYGKIHSGLGVTGTPTTYINKNYPSVNDSLNAEINIPGEALDQQ